MKPQKDKEVKKPKKGGLRRLLFGGKTKEEIPQSDELNTTDPSLNEASNTATLPPASSEQEKEKSGTGSSFFKFGKNRRKQESPDGGVNNTKSSLIKQGKGKVSSTTVSEANNANISTNKGSFKKVKKGKKPNFKRVPRPVREKKKGDVAMDKNKYYPGSVDFKYTTPREVWVPLLGRATELDLGNSARIIRDETDL